MLAEFLLPTTNWIVIGVLALIIIVLLVVRSKQKV